MDSRKKVELLKNCEIKLLYEKDDVRVSVIDYIGDYRVLKRYSKRNITSIYQKLLELQKKSECQYVAHIFEVEFLEGDTYIVEELLHGTTLETIISEEGVLDEQSFLNITYELCDALSYLHNNKPIIVHRDLKPDNIMVLEGGGIKLFDFDISRITQGDKSEDTEFWGTREYSAPEQLGAGETGPYTDIYALGVTMARMLYDDYPTYIDGKVKIKKRGKYNKIIKKCCQFDPRARYRSAEKVKKDIEKRKNKTKRIFGWIITIIILILSFATITWCLNKLGIIEYKLSFPSEKEETNTSNTNNSNGIVTSGNKQITSNNEQKTNDKYEELVNEKKWNDSRPKSLSAIPGVNREMIQFFDSRIFIDNYDAFQSSLELLGTAHVSSREKNIYNSNSLNWLKFCSGIDGKDPTKYSIAFYVEPSMISDDFSRNTKREDVINLLGKPETKQKSGAYYSDFFFFKPESTMYIFEDSWQYPIDNKLILIVKFYYYENRIIDYVEIDYINK